MSWISKKTGRPKEEGGHAPLKVSLDKFVREGLKKVGNKSQLIEKALKPILNQLDPGPACETLRYIDRIINEEITRALESRDYERIQALSNMADSLKEYRQLCDSTNTTSADIAQTDRPQALRRDMALTITIDRSTYESIIEDTMIDRAAAEATKNTKAYHKKRHTKP